MEEKKEYVKLWLSYEAYFEPYSDVEVGRLVRAMMKYRASGEEPEFNGNERYVWPAIRRDINASVEAQETVSLKNIENGKKGGRPKKPTAFPENPKNPPLFPESQKSQGKGQGQGKGKGQGKGQGQGQGEIRARVREAAEFWEQIAGNPVPSAMLQEFSMRLNDGSDMELVKEALRLSVKKHQPAAYFTKLLQNWAAEGIVSYQDYCARGYSLSRAVNGPAPSEQKKTFAELAAEREEYSDQDRDRTAYGFAGDSLSPVLCGEG